MKLRMFKKVIHRRKHYNHYPRCMDNMMIRVTEHFVYYTCHKLSARLCLDTDELVYIIKRKDKNDKADN